MAKQQVNSNKHDAFDQRRSLSEAGLLGYSWTVPDMRSYPWTLWVPHNNGIQCCPLWSPFQQGPWTWAPGHNVPLCPLTYGALALENSQDE